MDDNIAKRADMWWNSGVVIKSFEFYTSSDIRHSSIGVVADINELAFVCARILELL